MKKYQIICGDCLEVMKDMPDKSVNCSISSPPYWALRDYGVDGQLGLEPTFEEYIDKLCDIYDEVKRVLRPDGTCFVNLGDTYWSAKGTCYNPGGNPRDLKTGRGENQGLPEKCLCLIPQRFAIEMVNRGWICRNLIIWHKLNPMPSSARDRFTVDFEDVWYFTKSNKSLYWVRPDGKMVSRKPDHKSGKENLDWEWGVRNGKKVKLSLWEGRDYWFEPQYEPWVDKQNDIQRAFDKDLRYQGKHKDGYDKNTSRNDHLNAHATGQPIGDPTLGRNKRTVWTIPTQAFSEAHFATFPEKLVEPMIKAGCPEFVCKKCGKAREKIYDNESYITRPTIGRDTQKHKQQPEYSGGLARTGGHVAANHHFKGYTDCGCNAGWRPGVVLDMFRRQRHGRYGGCATAA